MSRFLFLVRSKLAKFSNNFLYIWGPKHSSDVKAVYSWCFRINAVLIEVDKELVEENLILQSLQATIYIILRQELIFRLYTCR